MKSLERANQWLERSKSNVARTKAGRVSPDILYEPVNEDDYSNAMQIAEKVLLWVEMKIENRRLPAMAAFFGSVSL